MKISEISLDHLKSLRSGEAGKIPSITLGKLAAAGLARKATAEEAKGIETSKGYSAVVITDEGNAYLAAH